MYVNDYNTAPCFPPHNMPMLMKCFPSNDNICFKLFEGILLDYDLDTKLKKQMNVIWQGVVEREKSQNKALPQMLSIVKNHFSI